MAEKNYTKREIDSMISNMQKDDNGFKEDVRKSLTNIEVQTTKTNGRVGRLEKWQSYVVGFCACLSLVFISVLIPVISIAMGLIHR